YRCKFCCVKSDHRFNKRTQNSILDQISTLKTHFGAEMENYHALYLGNHDALAAGEQQICFAAQAAYDAFGFKTRSGQRPFLFLFASVDAILKADQSLFEQLNQLLFYTYINVGFESLDSDTLKQIGKPITPSQVKQAFDKSLEVNAMFDHVEITGNFIIGHNMPENHNESLCDLLQNTRVEGKPKGAIYLSPLQDSPKKRELLPRFYNIKEKSDLPVFIYLIQRL
ncbi:MAG: radical SAM protein, partial [Desulfobacterales bacterium]|nr:radical SAM protein [Desulfobacterales bacterium]